MDDTPKQLEYTEHVSETRRISEKYARPAPAESLAAIEKALRNAQPNQAVEVLPEYVDAILAQRNAIHGDFTDDAQTAQALKYVMRRGKNWDAMPSYMREALEQMQTKVARILAGDFTHSDHYFDIIGYATLVMQRLK